MELVAFLLALMAGEVSEEEITSAVESWLADHPEATTTVEDGAITLAKLNSGAVATVNETLSYLGIE